jgi:phosphate starvation-inducible PhoH-like protein
MSKKVSKDSLSSKDCKNKRQALLQMNKLMKEYVIQFRNPNQESFYNTIINKDITICGGPAGTGKTYLAILFALKALVSKNSPYDGIVITKPLVEAEGEKLGYLPGDISEKTDPFMMSYWYTIRKLVGINILDTLVTNKIIDVIPMAYMRGLTLDNKLVILDEAQNATPEQIKMFLTRIGQNSKYIICGDIEQTDRKHINGLQDSLIRFANFDPIGLCMFSRKDIVRHTIIDKILERYNTAGGDGAGMSVYDIPK